jgi:hypothetical protein
MIKRGLFTTIVSLFVVIVSGQTDQPVAMGKWRTHLAYNNVTQIAQSANNIYAISDGALFSVNKEDTDDMQYFSKMSGLSDVNIVRIEFDKTNNQLLIIYQNGNIDIMHSTGVNNIPDLRNKQMSTTKGVNEVYFTGNFAYLSCDFGIMLVNMGKREIADTYIIGPNSTEVKVLSTTIHNNKIYALTASTVYAADADSRNLVNFEYWKPFTALPAGAGNYQKIFTFAGRLLVLKAGKLYKQEDDNSWSQLLSSVSNITSINVSNNKIIASNGSNSVYFLNQAFEMSMENLLGSRDIEYDPANDVYWVAAGSLGVVSFKLQSGADPIISYYKPQGPAVNIPWSMTFAGEKLFMVNGGRLFSQFNNPGKVMIYENGSWRNYDAAKLYEINGVAALDFMNVAVDPDNNNHFYVTSYGTGLYEFNDTILLNWYHHRNSSLEKASPVIGESYYYTRLDGAIFDKNKNLFLSNMLTNAGIKILLNTGDWTQLNFPNSNQEILGKILISNQNPNQKWVPSVRKNPGIFIWDDNGTLTDQNDDKSVFHSKFIDVDNVGSFISPTIIDCLEQDKNGVIWAGTDIGPLLFYNPSRAFDTGYTCSRVKIPRNDGTGLADYLLQNERIKSIAIDGANRKWLGTQSSGLYLMSENGQETIHHFTTSNSPLLSNDIISLAINPVSGEVFVGTSNGLMSFQSNAAESSNIYNNVYAYPNPVRENYNGIITITGLVSNTQVKITDLNGNLIYQTISNGSIATWDGKDAQGRKVNTGVYFAICANEDGSQSTITKIMVIN